MVIASGQPDTELLTYEAYLFEGRFEGRYDIVEGVRIIMPGASWNHQELVGNIYTLLRNYARTEQRGSAMMAPFDVLIRKAPRLQVRQPDVFFISAARLQSDGARQKGILESAPELVVEVISDSETERRVEDKLRDYHEIGVMECWRVWPERRDIDLLRWTEAGYAVVGILGANDRFASLALPDLTVSVSEIFAE